MVRWRSRSGWVWVDGVLMTPRRHPPCLDGYECDGNGCEFFAVQRCPILRVPGLAEDVAAIIAHGRERRQAYERWQGKVRAAVCVELRGHGRPLHYDMLARILSDRYPDLGPTPQAVLNVLNGNPELFECVSPGVWRAK